jgi:Sulfotransferase family
MQQAVTFPTFIIIGAERCGTTTVHHSLARHPQVLMSARKEPNYWLFDKHGRAPAGMTQQQIVAMEKRSGRTRRNQQARPPPRSNLHGASAIGLDALTGASRK